MLPHYHILNPAIEFMPPDDVAAMQRDRLREMVRYVYHYAPFWRRKFEAADITPADVQGLADLPRLPFVTRRELEANQSEHPPYGDYVGSHPSSWVRWMETSGTTGRRLQRVVSARDWEFVLARFLRGPNLSPGDTAVILGEVGSYVGFLALFDFLTRLGSLVICSGNRDARSKVRLLQEVRPAAVAGTPSTLLYLGEVAAQTGVALPALGIRRLLSIGEPGPAIPATHLRLRRAWGDQVQIRDGYGLTEFFPLGSNCSGSSHLHLPHDMVIVEIVDPQTGAPLPPGTPGEVVYTNLVSDTQPLLRYRTGDIAALDPAPACPGCGRTVPRLMQILGRVDDMVWFHGEKIFSSAIESVLAAFQELTPEFRVYAAEVAGRPQLRVRVEVRHGVPLPERGNLHLALVQALSEATGCVAAIEMLAEGTLPRSEHKSKRLILQPEADRVYSARTL